MFENKYYEIGKALLYIENWDSAIITTTFVQLFSTLIGYKNKALKKFHNLANSIIILDEVQNIPFKYWKIVNKILKVLSDKFNSYIILLTATKPLIFSKKESVELLENHKSFYALDNLNRTHITETNINSIAQLIEHLSNEINNSNLIMIVSNTISSTLEIFKEISEIIEFDQFQKIYLSTNITPYERLQRINKIKDEEFDKAIIITTQLIEAGVDIDVDVIYRDFAPLDSIIQAAGRANRNGSPEKTGEIKLMNLVDEKRNNDIRLSSYIYGQTNLQATKNSIQHEFEEKNFLEIIANYFEEISEKKSSFESIQLENAMRGFYFSDKYLDKKTLPISEFKLIENLPNYVSLFVNIDESANETWQAFINIKNIEDPIKRKNEFKKIKGDFSKYIINIPEKHTQVCEPIIPSNLYYFDANLDKNNENYDKTENSGTGLKREISNWIM
jgi:CRISPR-associated endonuclease/helicase Cas3